MFEQNHTSPLSTMTSSATSTEVKERPLRDSVEQALRNYFGQLDGEEVTELYELVLSEVEAPLLDVVMQYTRGNQTRASIMLGINRGTLRKKLKKYGMN
ncbi:DNA-binding transcriptional regulator Fis [Alginatibacterium sediminis]|uniref:DNA-binding protein Fis n=1 Tax=Alginatibacterium sediminis TaxID=2164068 RepID=A0A420E7G4_9ALTE|nr:DNA-binding transcriptional regulator Fis [Alginatibacterium sediminis]RKF14462.1 DNA-binding transcriptional regulator Fis [Alginatibacterium sediminis]